MAQWIACIFPALFLLALSLHAQTAPGVVIAGGYRPPAPLEVAPGQVVTLFVHSAGTRAEAALAGPLPLPAMLGGFSVALRQTFAENSAFVPLFAVFPIDNCVGLFPISCIALTAITVQIPLELAPNIAGAGRPANFAVLTITENGATGEAFPLSPVTDNIHILTTCDVSASPVSDGDRTGACQAVVRHADGKLVSQRNPAAAGETLTLHAYGLGHAPNLITGEAAPEAVAFPDVALELRFGANLAAARPGEASIAPLFAGAAAGEAGLYYVVFQVPEIPDGTPPCIGGGIRSNFSVSIARSNSFDSAGICVALPDGN